MFVGKRIPATSNCDVNPALLIAVTGYGREEDSRKASSAGFDGHLVKPVSFTEITHLRQSVQKAPEVGNR
jgi:CheY-like chemotaxis protein